jgi:cytochrome c-type biogenesis protein CcmH/NrfG
MGELLHAKALGAELEPAERDALLREARRHYVRSYELDPDAPETYAMYGRTFLAVGQDPAQGIETLEHAHRLLRPNAEIRRWLAKAYAMTGQEERARGMLERMLAWSHDDARVERSQEAWQDLVKPEGAE